MYSVQYAMDVAMLRADVSHGIEGNAKAWK